MDKQCALHLTIASIAYCAECDQPLCSECFNSHKHFAISMKYYKGICAPIIERNKCVRFSELLNKIKATIEATIDSELSHLKTREKECEENIVIVAKEYKLENSEMIIEKLKKKMNEQSDAFFSGIDKLLNDASTKMMKSITDAHNSLSDVKTVSSDSTSPSKQKTIKDPKIGIHNYQ